MQIKQLSFRFVEPHGPWIAHTPFRTYFIHRDSEGSYHYSPNPAETYPTLELAQQAANAAFTDCIRKCLEPHPAPHDLPQLSFRQISDDNERRKQARPDNQQTGSQHDDAADAAEVIDQLLIYIDCLHELYGQPPSKLTTA